MLHTMHSMYSTQFLCTRKTDLLMNLQITTQVMSLTKMAARCWLQIKSRPEYLWFSLTDFPKPLPHLQCQDSD